MCHHDGQFMFANTPTQEDMCVLYILHVNHSPYDSPMTENDFFESGFHAKIP